MADALIEGRAAFDRHEWGEAYAQLSAAEAESTLGPADLAALGKAAFLTGNIIESREILARAHSAHLDAGACEEAALVAFWLGFQMMTLGERAQGSGWIARARRVLDQVKGESAVRGFLLLPDALGSLGQGDPTKALELFGQAVKIGEAFGDVDLQTLGRLGKGQSLILLGDTADGMTLLDETMIAVMTGDVSPMVVGIVYCAVISSCQQVFDLRRAREWTDAFSRWCSSEPDLVPFRGECLTQRAEIMQVHGDWADALDEARRAGEFLTQDPGQPAAGAAFYRQAELHRLRGNVAEAEAAYREAGRWGRSMHPGLALLRLLQGRGEAAAASVIRALGEARDRRGRIDLLAAAIDIHLACGGVERARACCDELTDLARGIDTPYLTARSRFSEGCVLLHEGRHTEAYEALNAALGLWRQIGAPYEAARTRVRIAEVCRELGDVDGCEIEIEAARRTFEELEARPDLERLGADFPAAEPQEAPAGLTAREVEVLQLVAGGLTNRAVGEELFISEKTVARHVSNIFSKLGVSSRSAATAFAYEHGLV